MMLKNWLQRSSGSFYHRQQSSLLLRRLCSSALTKNNHLLSSPPSIICAHRFKSNNSAQHYFSSIDGNKRSSFATATTAADSSDDAPLRRRRRKPSAKSQSNDETTDPSTSSSNMQSTSSEAFFSPINTSTGQLLTSDQYLQLASLSPWVPCPDVVSKRVFEIATANETDVHVDLGCGDGRLNFMAVDGSTRVGKSWGVDVDENILNKCYERLGRRFVPSKKKNNSSEEEEVEEESLLEFVKADLVEVIELQKKLYQQQELHLLGGDDAAIEKSVKNATSNINDANNESLQSITNKIANSTIITMYFVDNALQQIQPYLSSILGGRKNVRVITIGYEMPNKDGWNASWVERVLGLTIFRYDMENVSRFPLDWSLKNDDGDGDDGSNDKSMGANDIPSSTDENNEDVEEFLRRKRQEDIEELNRGLRIHHDEELDEFAHARAKKQGLSAQSGSKLILEEGEDGDEWDDFDETEDPEELMKEAQRRMMEDRKASRGKMMAGVGGERKKSSRTGSTAAPTKPPTWKKP
ncbi:hypothetical protein ACHAWT_000443 [Skeletonema menzelii]